MPPFLRRFNDQYSWGGLRFRRRRNMAASRDACLHLLSHLRDALSGIMFS